MVTASSSELVRKLRSLLQEPDDLSIWRYAVATRPYRDQAWAQHVNDYRITEKIRVAKEDGSWDAIVGRFLEKASFGDIPLSVFLTEDGRKWLRDISGQLSIK
ncbi:hypothetical protein EZJ19_01015 [Parasulfuritortus cantonensis]|uniref:Uncharacterized protein n=1 Tax=Parasulfuritortus cantonensis TaxID=2528202 RepID=A0A4R1BSH8_9PROT|nr:hypothetical protein [Parasulfuritortus cantonensis]TCJ20185.1 hypothetical protein EZJ19_01015 [Parasulfuritortus cantonensis]